MSTTGPSPTDVTRRQPWHLSAVHLDGGSTLTTLVEVDDEPVTDGPDDVVTDAAIPRPLWFRIVTGRSIAWRLRGIRRHSARRAIHWMGLHPELKNAAYERGVRGIVGFVAHRAWKAPPAHSLGYRSEVHVDRRVEVAGAHPLALLDDVDVHADVHVDEGGDHTLTLSSAGTLVTVTDDRDLRSVQLLAPIDLRVWSPQGFPYRRSTWPIPLEPLVSGDDAQAIHKRLLVARSARSVRCELDGHHPPEQIARWIVDLAAAGTPLIGDVSDPVRSLIGDRLSSLLGGMDAARLGDDDERERYSLSLRKCAITEFSARGRWRQIGDRLGADVNTTPQISVLLPSNRPGDIEDAVRRVAAQRGVDVQLVVGLHGDHMPERLEAHLAALFDGDLVVLRLPGEMNLGQVMNALTGEADRPLVSKWDDDDWYDVDHLADLVLAMEYSGAAMVGKAAEFVRLESIDLTIRRLASGAERESTTIAGGALMIARHDLERVGWADVPREVDRRLIDALERSGMTTYRTHGFGYVLRRRSGPLAQHTWKTGDDYFLRQAEDQRLGLDLQFAGFSPDAIR